MKESTSSAVILHEEYSLFLVGSEHLEPEWVHQRRLHQVKTRPPNLDYHTEVEKLLLFAGFLTGFKICILHCLEVLESRCCDYPWSGQITSCCVANRPQSDLASSSKLETAPDGSYVRTPGVWTVQGLKLDHH